MRIPEHGISNALYNIAFWLGLPLLVNLIFWLLLFGVFYILGDCR